MRRPADRCLASAGAVLATTVMILAASACAGRRGDAEPPGPAATASATAPVDHGTLVRAVEATRAVESGRVRVETAVTGLDDVPDPPPGGRLTVATYQVAFDRRAGRVDVEADLSAAAGAVGAPDVAVGGDAGTAARMIAVGDTVYARAGPMAPAVGRSPRGWVEIDRAAFVDRRPGSDAASLLLDPLSPFDIAGDASGDARVVGHAVIRGSPVTQLAARSGTGGGAAPLDVWIDAGGVIRRLELRLAGNARAGAGRIVTTIELFDIDRPVSITPPGGER